MGVCKEYDSMGVKEMRAPFEALGKVDRDRARGKIKRSAGGHV